jgi:hypothetical protein
MGNSKHKLEENKKIIAAMQGNNKSPNLTSLKKAQDEIHAILEKDDI